MAFDAAILERGQWKREGTPGSAQAATNVFPGLTIDLDPSIPEFWIDANGYDAPVELVFGKERSVGTVRAETLDFNALILCFASYFKYAAPATPTDGVLTRRWTFDPLATAEQTVASYTLEVGPAGSTAGRRTSFTRFNTFEITNDPTRAAAFSANLVARSLTFPFSLTTASVVEVTQKVIGPRMVDVYLATTEAGLGAGQIKPLSITLRGGEKYGDIYLLDSANTSYEDLVTRRFGVSATIEINKRDSATNTYLTSLRAATTLYLQVVYTGSEIESVGAGPTVYSWVATLTLPVKMHDMGFGAVQDVVSNRFTLTSFNDPTFNSNAGGRFKAVIDSTLTAL